MGSVLDASRNEVVSLYLAGEMPVGEIGRRYGVSRQTVWKNLKAWGVANDPERVWREVECQTCGETFQKRRKQLARSRKDYCSAECYFVSVKNPEYQQWRHGQRIARAEVRRHFPFLEEGHVVHHKDGNSRNNEVENLMVFRNQSDHMKWHRGNPDEVVPLFDGGA